jgi:hypothetical protein
MYEVYEVYEDGSSQNHARPLDSYKGVRGVTWTWGDGTETVPRRDEWVWVGDMGTGVHSSTRIWIVRRMRGWPVGIIRRPYCRRQDRRIWELRLERSTTFLPLRGMPLSYEYRDPGKCEFSSLDLLSYRDSRVRKRVISTELSHGTFMLRSNCTEYSTASFIMSR